MFARCPRSESRPRPKGRGRDSQGRENRFERIGSSTCFEEPATVRTSRKAGEVRRNAWRMPKWIGKPFLDGEDSPVGSCACARNGAPWIALGRTDGRRPARHLRFVQADHETNTSDLLRSLVCFCPWVGKDTHAGRSWVATTAGSAILCRSTIHDGRLMGHWRSWLARLYDTQEVTGSNPVWPTLEEIEPCFAAGFDFFMGFSDHSEEIRNAERLFTNDFQELRSRT